MNHLPRGLYFLLGLTAGTYLAFGPRVTGYVLIALALLSLLDRTERPEAPK